MRQSIKMKPINKSCNSRTESIIRSFIIERFCFVTCSSSIAEMRRQDSREFSMEIVGGKLFAVLARGKRVAPRHAKFEK